MKYAIVDERIGKEASEHLALLGFKLIKLPPHKDLSEGVQSHTDMLIYRSGNTLLCQKDYLNEVKELSALKDEVSDRYRFITCETEFKSNYPFDARLNALNMGDTVFCKSDTVSEDILSLAKKQGKRIVHTNQGYPACTTLKLSEKNAITSDAGMAKILSDNGIKVTLIKNGEIDLPPYKYGFIGGCAGICDGVVYFNGQVELHPSFDLIKDAIEEASLRYVCLSGKKLRDVGGILFLE